jgi:hypothetical protein
VDDDNIRSKLLWIAQRHTGRPEAAIATEAIAEIDRLRALRQEPDLMGVDEAIGIINKHRAQNKVNNTRRWRKTEKSVVLSESFNPNWIHEEMTFDEAVYLARSVIDDIKEAAHA